MAIDLLGRTTSYADANSQTTTSNYDSLGRLASRSGPLGGETFTYDNYNRLTDQQLDSVSVAKPYYDAYGRLDHVDYPTAGASSGKQVLTITRDSLGRTTGQTYTLGNGTTTVADNVNHSQSGQIISGTENGVAKSYTYDRANRLTNATIGSNTYTYGFGTPSGCSGTYNTNAGKNSNRTSQTINTTTTTYCYDQADRLLTSSQSSLTNAQYDQHGNTTQLGSGTQTKFEYDSSDRNTKITEGSKNVTYTRDVQNRITTRTLVNGTTTTNKYTFTTTGDTPDLLLNSSNGVVEKYEQLPGGVLLTIRPSQSGAAQKVHSLPNIHGDVMLTTDANGTSTGTFTYDPFGNKTSSTLPNNTATNSTYGWVGQHEKDTETAFALSPTEMGARVYLSSTGRFLSVDPIEGGTPNNYVYPPDVVNDFDLDGRATINYGIGGCIVICVGVNAIHNTSNGSWYYSLGSGFGLKGPSIMYGKGGPETGWSVAGGASAIIGANASYNRKRWSREYGFAGPGVSISAQHTSRLTRGTWYGQGKGKSFKKDSQYLKDLRSGKLKRNYYQPQRKRR
ncbi:MAG TPA: RHS repeat-associated core domain-containing protein [Nevskiaceae bacterium]|nr:RHS repeat-associated core domain-containing protein [Nevskiaceae bacterium]